MGKSQFSDFKPCDKAGKVAAIYIRVSRNEFKSGPDGEEEQRQSVKTQESDAIERCKKEGWKYKVYSADCDLSGTMPAGTDKTKGERADLNTLLKDVDAGLIHTIIIRDLSRIARNARHLKEIVFDRLIPNGVNLYGLNQPLDITTAAGRVFVSMLAEFAELEVYSTRNASVRNREQAALDGELPLGTNTYGYDYGKGSVTINEEEAKIVIQVFKMFTHEGMSCQKIANKLNEAAVRTKLKGAKSKKRDFTNALWGAGQVYKMIHNPRYIGKIVYNKKLCSSIFPTIVDMKLWEAAQVEGNKRIGKGPSPGPRMTNSSHLMSGILQCGYCLQDIEQKKSNGLKIAPNMAMGSTTGGNTYYICQTRAYIKKDNCRGARVPKKKLEAFIEDFIGHFAASEFNKLVVNEPETVSRLQNEIKALQIDLEKAKKKQAMLAKHFADSGDTDVKVLLDADKECKERVFQLEKKIRDRAKELDEINLVDVKDSFGILKKWKKLDAHSRRTALQRVIPKAVMYEDRLELYVGSLNNPPVVVPYERSKKRRNAREFPVITDQWPVFVGEGKMLRYGARLGDGIGAYEG